MPSRSTIVRHNSRTVGALLLAAACSLLPAYAMQPAAKDEPQSAAASAYETPVLALKARAAIGDRAALPFDIRLAGRAMLLSKEVDVEHLIDPSGAFVTHYHGPIPLAYGHDGTTTWMRDLGGEERVLNLGEAEHALFVGAILSGSAFHEKGPLRFAPADEPATLRFTYHGGRLNGVVTFDPQTGLPTRWSYRFGGTERAIETTGSITLGGLTLTREVRTLRAGVAEQELIFTEAAQAPNYLRSPYEFLGAHPGDVTFDAGVPANLAVTRAPTGHLLVRVSIDGGPPGTFIFDTGAGITVVDSTVWAGAEIEAIAQIPTSGVGGVVMSAFGRARSLSVGPVTITSPLVIRQDLGFLREPLGEPIAGIIGFPLLARCVARIDMRDETISLHDPATFTLTDGEWMPLILENRLPCVPGKVEGHDALYCIDTGASGHPVVFHTSAVESLNLLEGRQTTGATLGGIGGMVAARAGVIGSVTVGPTHLERFRVAFATERVGAFGESYTTGTLGGAMLRHFRIVTDYPNRRIALVRREGAPALR